ncbi:uncharacterized protein LOC26535606 [Drosophila yakuba]|uniref:Uncharacterized protein n=1 Tax=Drosophila yakuba TaxID=7245 RepID=A0A0R1E0M8_DROYA|nr:uncharacterized protein LOC26535606 [Drosophila yakuba]XP_039230196.1 uncharacterized protein LOC26535606 [Drosophila yakuba]KRK01050.1 uncharacterized protein Dyak_GE28425 [Drosophila yakuba]
MPKNMRNNQADNTQRQKLGLERKRQRQRRVWGLTVAVAMLVALRQRVYPIKTPEQIISKNILLHTFRNLYLSS